MFWQKKINVFPCANGQILPIEDVPDSMFSEKMLGDGVAINPSDGEIFSPVDGKIIMLQDSLHAIGIETDEGIELLIHIGLDTVKLKGNGFHAKVKIDDYVKVGDPLICFEKDYVEKCGYNPITMLLVMQNDRVKKIRKKYDPNTSILTITYD